METMKVHMEHNNTQEQEGDLHNMPRMLAGTEEAAGLPGTLL